MLRIAIVEDQAKDARILKDYLHRYEREYSIQFQIDVFHDGMSFISEYSASFSIVLMDIEMPLMDGLSAARRLRDMDESVCLIFVTNMAQYAIKGYEVDAVDFLVKPLQYSHFAMKLQKAIRNNGLRQNHFVAVDTRDGLVRLNLARVRYIESNKHYLTYFTEQESYRSRGSLKDAMKELPVQLFARCHASYLVNLDHVLRVGTDNVILRDRTLPLSRTYKKEFMDAFTRYLGGVR